MAKRGTLDWMTVLDVKRALINCHTDLTHDWYRDPWSWPELKWVVDTRPDMVVARLNSTGVQRSANIDVPKENFATRPAIVMDPIDRLIYQALVDRVSVPAIGDLRTWVYGWRLVRRKPRPGEYSDNSDEHLWYRSRVSLLSGVRKFGLATDIVSCFASISIDGVCDEIETRSGSGVVVDRLIDMLQAWGRVAGRSGLPQRSMASSALANMFLRPLDDVIEAEASTFGKQKRTAATRWMDDIWVFGKGAGTLRAIQLALESRMRDLGLNMNAAKTHVLEGDDLMEATRRLQHSAVDVALDEEPADPQPLEDLVDRLLTKPEEASRTSIKFATVRIRDHQLWSMVQAFADNAHRMPHASDALARLFREDDAWRDLEKWYVKYSGSAWGSLPWALGQLGTMFPSGDAGRGDVADHLLGELEAVPPIQMLALAAQRSAAWKPVEARAAVREAAKKADHPLQRRILALTALGLKDERAFIRKLLREFEQNEVTLQMIEDRKFRPLPVTADFR